MASMESRISSASRRRWVNFQSRAFSGSFSEAAASQIWSALGGELKPSLDVVVTTPFPVSPEFEAAPPVTQAGVRVRSTTGSPDDSALRTGPRTELP